MFFDTHAHYCDRKFDKDRDDVLSSMPGSGVSLILDAGSGIDALDRSVALAQKYDFMYASAGVHPHDTEKMTDEHLVAVEQLQQNPKVVAVGEIGLDYHYDFSPRDIQRLRFREQLEIAGRVGKPAIVHQRESLEDTLAIVSEYRDVGGVFHCFGGSVETAKRILDMGWYLSFGGIVTFKNARKVLDVIKMMPAERILLETDCPYISPEPYRGRRNDSTYLIYIAAKIAEVRGSTTEEIAELTRNNGKRLFCIG